MLPAIFSLLTPKIVKGIIEYVFDKNELDYKVDALIEKIEKLEEDSHPPQNWDAKITALEKQIKQIKGEK